MALTYSKTRKPTALQAGRLFKFAHWAKHRKPAAIRAMLRNTPLFYTAWDGKTLIGMARVMTDFSFRAVLWDVVVDPAYGRLGVGSRLVRSALKEPRLKRVESLWLTTTDKQAFYRRFGFKLSPKSIMVKKFGGKR